MTNASPFKDTSPAILRLATLMASRSSANKPPYTLLLGAGASVSSNAPTWAELCKTIAKDMGAEIPRNQDPVAYVVRTLFPQHAHSIERSVAISKHLKNLQPSIGYKHLAQLVSTGYIRNILTTNWDPLVEVALSQFMPVSEIKVLVRGEVPDDLIADYIKAGDMRVKIIKLHGDLTSRLLLMRDEETHRLSPALKEAVQSLIKTDIIVVGSQLNDIDILSALLNELDDSSIYYVAPTPPGESSITARLVKRESGVVISGIEGAHDEFFKRLNLAVQKRYCDEAIERKRAVEAEILVKEEQGRGFINYSAIGELIKKFASMVLTDEPDVIFFINDPTAPGGIEVMKRMLKPCEGVAIGEIKVTGEGKNRVFERKVRDREAPKFRAGKKQKEIRTVFIIDSITFSGKTLKLARDKVRKWYPHAVVKLAVLVVSQHFRDALGKDEADLIKFMKVTDRYEVFFPWGVTQTTGDFDRKFLGIDGTRAVNISKRPWGTIEILASEEKCSVRLLTLEADEKLSFQRHVCRDELFVALDDKIGLDICAENLSDGPFDRTNPDIKSLILEKGDYILIPRGIWHRSKSSKERVRLLEVGFGLYDQTGDIERLDDAFGRTEKDGSQ
jgi:mannose-6-phosphate isomerase-like protein (cupin superfamily)/NAD-dependent SIR2 family protein deacetylase